MERKKLHAIKGKVLEKSKLCVWTNTRVGCMKSRKIKRVFNGASFFQDISFFVNHVFTFSRNLLKISIFF